MIEAVGRLHGRPTARVRDQIRVQRPAAQLGRGRAIALVLATFAIAWAVTGAGSAVAGSEEDDQTGSLTWSVRPGDANGPDGRSWVELTLDPGHSVTEHLVIVNHSRQPATFTLSAADGYFTDTGRFNMLPSDRASTGAGTWIQMQDSVALEAGQSAIVPYTITVPEDATPGDHPAGVAASILASDGAIGIESRVGFRVMTRVTGELAPSLAVTATARYAGSLNPFEPGRIRVDYRIENTGNVRLGAAPQITATGPLGAFPTTRDAEPIAELAPGEHRDGSLVIRSRWPVFAYTVDVTATATPVDTGVPVVTADPTTTTVAVAAIPWPQLAALAIAILLAALWVRGRQHRQRELERLVEQAREEARAEV